MKKLMKSSISHWAGLPWGHESPHGQRRPWWKVKFPSLNFYIDISHIKDVFDYSFRDARVFKALTTLSDHYLMGVLHILKVMVYNPLFHAWYLGRWRLWSLLMTVSTENLVLTHQKYESDANNILFVSTGGFSNQNQHESGHIIGSHNTISLVTTITRSFKSALHVPTLVCAKHPKLWIVRRDVIAYLRTHVASTTTDAMIGWFQLCNLVNRHYPRAGFA